MMTLDPIEPWRACDFEMSLMLWGYDLSGDAAERSALVGEHPHIAHLWDRDESYLARIERRHGGQRVHVPEWWALPCVVDQELDDLARGDDRAGQPRTT